MNPQLLKVPRAVVLGLSLILVGLILNYILERHNPIKLWENSPYPISWADVLYPPVCLFLSLTGLFLVMNSVFFGATKRTFGVSAGFAVSATVLFSMFMLAMQFVASGADRLGECQDIDLAANRSNLIPQSEWAIHRAAVGCAVERRGMFLSYYNDIAVYGVTERRTQQRILDDVAEHYRAVHTHPIQVRFFERENVITTFGKNGTTFQKTGPVTLIRVANIG